MSKTQPMERIEFVQRELEGYRDYVEDWKRDHIALTHYWAAEDVIRKANFVFDSIVRLRKDLKAISLGEEALELHVRRFHLLREWVKLSDSVMADFVPRLEADYGEVEGAGGMRANIEHARAEIESIDWVTIDANGYVYETTGERAIVPGVDPARLARSIKDANAGRTRSLKDIIAARASH
jgi:hypothetical protein